MTAHKRIYLVAGPNGAGKSTFATEYLAREADCPDFVNADLIAAGLSGFRPSSVAFLAGRLAVKTIHGLAARGESFAFETTLSGKCHARWIGQWQKKNYFVTLRFLWLPSADICVARVRQRVSEGGHDVPESVIRRRYHLGWHNFRFVYRDLVDEWFLIDNSGGIPVLLEKEENL